MLGVAVVCFGVSPREAHRMGAVSYSAETWYNLVVRAWALRADSSSSSSATPLTV